MDGGIGKPFPATGTAFSWLVVIQDVLGTGTVSLISIGDNPETDEGNFLFSGTALFSDGNCDLSAVIVVLATVLGTSVRGKLGTGLVSGCCCTEA